MYIRYLKLLAIFMFIGVLLSTPRSVRAQESTVTTLQVSPTCTLTKQILPRQATRTITTGNNATIITVWTDRGAQNPVWGATEVKVWIAPGQPSWTVYDATVTTWTSSNCTTNQMYTEFQRNPLPAKTWGELCNARITCQPATTGPTPTPTDTVCKMVQGEGGPPSNRTIQPARSGKLLMIWTNRGAQNPPWGTAEVKVWMDPSQPEWKLYNAGGTFFYSETCTPDQMYGRFKQENKQEVTWSQLCAAGITCPPKTPTTPTPGQPALTCNDMQPRMLMHGDNTLPVPNNAGAILTVWSGKQSVPWGSSEKKTFMKPGENWNLYTAGGTMWTSQTCSYQQMTESFKQVQYEEKTWQALCEAGITCMKN